MKSVGCGSGYRYPHDEPTGVSAQAYLPDALLGARYYTPTRHGAEAAWADVAERVSRLREGRAPDGSPHER